MKFDRDAFLRTPRTPTYDRREDVFVYVFHDDGRCKVGVSAKPDQRLKQLRAGNARDVECVWSLFIPSRPAALAAEREIHRILSNASLGREWFQIGPTSAVDVCEQVCDAAFELLERWAAILPETDYVGPVMDRPRKNMGFDAARERAAKRLGLT